MRGGRKVEEQARSLKRRAQIQDAILGTLYGMSALTLAMLAPNTLQLLRYVTPPGAQRRNPTYRIHQAVTRLESRGFVVRKKSTRGIIVELTEKGRRRANALHEVAQLPIPKVPRRWDGRWRIVIFDVWERRRAARDRLRALLMKVGFVRIQNSVWVYPYDCEELIAFIRADLKLGKGLLYIIAEGIEYDKHLRTHFKLQRL